MSILNSLTLSTETRAKTITDPIARKREKLIINLERQIKAVEAEDKGEISTFLAVRTVIHPETKERTRRDVSVKTRPWYFRDLNGAFYIVMKYGNKRLELAKGKQSIIVGERKKLIPTFEKLIEAVKAGELDELIKGAAKFGASKE